MYFEDIYNKVEPLWKREFSLKGIEETETYIEDIRQDYSKIDHIVDFKEKEKYTVWESMLTFTMYKTLTDFGEKKYEEGNLNSFKFDQVPLALFEKDYIENIKAEGNEEYLNQYKGFRNPPR